MTLTQIQYFLEVCQTMNFTKAAQNLYVAQPSLSRQIQLLETELGVQLLMRSNRNVILTEAGKVFMDEFGQIAQHIEMAIHKIKDAGTIKKEIKLGLFLGLSPQMISSLIEKMNIFFRDYKIHMNKYSSYNLKKAFEVGNVDLVVGMDGCAFAGQNDCCCHIEKVPAYLVFSEKLFPGKGMPESLSDFNGKKFICVEDEMADQLVCFQKEIIKKLGIRPSEYIKTENMVATLLYNEAASGFSVWRHGAPEGLRAYPVPGDVAVFSMNVCWKKDTKLPFRQFFEEYYGYHA